MASADARRRSGQTRARRTREALLTAARECFAANGWQATRVEDVAKAANVAVATAFNHFSKQSLLGHAYTPLFAPVLAKAAADIAKQTDPVEAVTRHIHYLATVAAANRRLTTALVAAVNEQAIAANRPPAPDDLGDVRSIVPLPAPLIDLVAYGQAAGVFHPKPPAAEVAVYHTNALALLILTRSDKSAKQIADIVLSQLLPALTRPRD